MKIFNRILYSVIFLFIAIQSFASEADLAIPDLHAGKFNNFGGLSGWDILLYGAFVICGTLGISLLLRHQVKSMRAHESMLKVAEIIFQTCRTYLIQQGKFLLMLFVSYPRPWRSISIFQPLNGVSVVTTTGTLILVLLFSVVGMGGSYAVAWYGIRVNTYANARTAFASLCRKALGCCEHSPPRRHERWSFPDLP